MSIKVGKKYVLLPLEVYESLLQKADKHNISNILAKPEKSALNNADNNMKNVWERDDLPPDEKVKAFTKELNSLQRYRDSMIKSREPIVKGEKDDIKAKDTIEEKKDSVPSKPELEEVLGVLPKTIRKEASQILRFLKSNPENISWNKDKELIYKGTVLRGSNIGDLLLDTLSNRKKLISPVLFTNTFSKALAEVDMPKEWIRSEKMKDLIDIQDKENNIKSRRKRSRSTPYPVNFSKIVLKLHRNGYLQHQKYVK